METGEAVDLLNGDMTRVVGFSYLFTTYVDSWLAMVLLDSVWGFNGMFTFYPGTLLLSKQLGPSLCRHKGAQE